LRASSHLDGHIAIPKSPVIFAPNGLRTSAKVLYLIFRGLEGRRFAAKAGFVVLEMKQVHFCWRRVKIASGFRGPVPKTFISGDFLVQISHML